VNELTDQQLLRDFAERRSDATFTELVRRHVDLVYSAAFRMTGEAHSAQDVTQAVFVALAQSAAGLTHHPVLSGWLHTTARNLAAKQVRTAVRRQQLEQEAAAMNELLSNASDVSWEEIAPHLDAAIGELTGPERNLVLLRYFERKTAGEIGGLLGISEEAAQKRLSRAVERLREFFAERGVTVGAGGLAIIISANAVQAAPVGLITTISTAALAGTAVTTSTIIATTAKTIAMTTLQKVLITATLAVVAGAGVYEAKQVHDARAEVQTLQQQQTPLADQVQQLQNSYAEATNRLANLLAENLRLKSNPNGMELLKLRGEVTRLRTDAGQANDPMVKKALRWKANVEKMKLLFAEHPEQQVPEMKLLSDDYFFDLARDQDLESSNGVRKAFSEIRMRAKNTFAYPLQLALQKYIEQNNGLLPAAAADLKPYFEIPPDDAMLDQYTMLYTGSMSDVKGNFVMRDKQVVDPELDDAWEIGPNAYGPDGSTRVSAGMQAAANILAPAIKSFMDANGGQQPAQLDQLKPFISTPEQQAAYNDAVKSGMALGGSK
jgi:RNA polymerase sigma factor (sigma-70 family)